MDKKYQVFISSTYEDLKAERLSVINTVLEMDCIPSGMEAFCAEDEEQFEVIKKVIDLCDYYILIIGKRYGSINESKGISYTEMEYDYALEKGIPILVFMAHDSVDLPEDNEQEKLKLFKEKAFSKRMGAVWSGADDLSKKVAISLMKAFKNNKRPGWTRDNVFDQAELLSQINNLRVEKDNMEKEASEAKKKNEELKKEVAALKEQLDSVQNSPEDIIPLEELVIPYTIKDYFGDVKRQIKAIDIYKYVSIKMQGVSLAQSYLNDQICEAMGTTLGKLSDKSLPDKISNYFVSLKLMTHSWNEKNRRNYFFLTTKGENTRDRLNGFYKQ